MVDAEEWYLILVKISSMAMDVDVDKRLYQVATMVSGTEPRVCFFVGMFCKEDI